MLETVKRGSQLASLGYRIKNARKQTSDSARHAAQKHIADRLGRLRGLPQKVGQMVAFSNSSISESFEELFDSGEEMPLALVETILESEWGRPVDQVLSHLSTKGKSASLGQVHKATMLNGLEVAIKVQFPGIQSAVETDLRMLGWLSKPFGGLSKGFDLASYQRVISESLDCELDYRQEAAQQQLFHEWSRETKGLIVPRVLSEWSTDQVLVSEWHEGETWQIVQSTWTKDQRLQMSRKLIHLFLDGLFRRGLVHADLHPGNIRFVWNAESTPSVLLYDFGFLYQPTANQRLILLELIRRVARGKGDTLDALVALGFDYDYLEPIQKRLPAVVRLLCEPFVANYPYDTSSWDLSTRLADVLGDDRMNFRVAGPPELLGLLRSIHGLCFYLNAFDQPINWSSHLRTITNQYEDRLNAMDIPTMDSQANLVGLARHLKVAVDVDGSRNVQLTSPASAIEDLPSLLGADVLDRIAQRGIELSEVVRDVRRRGYLPGSVFELVDQSKTIKVWLE